MYASVITTQLKRGTMAEAISIYAESIVPAMQYQPGFEGANLMINEDTDTAVSTTYWETKTAMLASEASGYLQGRLAQIGELLTAPPANSHYEVAVKVSV